MFCANISVYCRDFIFPTILCQYLCVFWGFDIPKCFVPILVCILGISYSQLFVPIFVCILGDLIFPSVESDSGASSQVEDLPHSGDQVLAVSCICSFSHVHICTFHIFSFAYLPTSALLECIFAYIT